MSLSKDQVDYLQSMIGQYRTNMTQEGMQGVLQIVNMMEGPQLKSIDQVNRWFKNALKSKVPTSPSSHHYSSQQQEYLWNFYHSKNNTPSPEEIEDLMVSLNSMPGKIIAKQSSVAGWFANRRSEKGDKANGYRHFSDEQFDELKRFYDEESKHPSQEELEHLMQLVNSMEGREADSIKVIQSWFERRRQKLGDTNQGPNYSSYSEAQLEIMRNYYKSTSNSPTADQARQMIPFLNALPGRSVIEAKHIQTWFRSERARNGEISAPTMSYAQYSAAQVELLDNFYENTTNAPTQAQAISLLVDINNIEGKQVDDPARVQSWFRQRRLKDGVPADVSNKVYSADQVVALMYYYDNTTNSPTAEQAEELMQAVNKMPGKTVTQPKFIQSWFRDRRKKQGDTADNAATPAGHYSPDQLALLTNHYDNVSINPVKEEAEVLMEQLNNLPGRRVEKSQHVQGWFARKRSDRGAVAGPTDGQYSKEQQAVFLKFYADVCNNPTYDEAEVLMEEVNQIKGKVVTSPKYVRAWFHSHRAKKGDTVTHSFTKFSDEQMSFLKEIYNTQTKKPSDHEAVEILDLLKTVPGRQVEGVKVIHNWFRYNRHKNQDVHTTNKHLKYSTEQLVILEKHYDDVNKYISTEEATILFEQVKVIPGKQLDSPKNIYDWFAQRRSKKGDTNGSGTVRYSQEQVEFLEHHYDTVTKGPNQDEAGELLAQLNEMEGRKLESSKHVQDWFANRRSRLGHKIGNKIQGGYSSDQIDFLKQRFLENSYPTSEDMMDMIEELNKLPGRKINTHKTIRQWFGNRRKRLEQTTRIQYSAEQINILEQEYLHNSYPSQEDAERLEIQLNEIDNGKEVRDYKQVLGWFNRRRYAGMKEDDNDDWEEDTSSRSDSISGSSTGFTTPRKSKEEKQCITYNDKLTPKTIGILKKIQEEFGKDASRNEFLLMSDYLETSVETVEKFYGLNNVN